MIRYLISGAGLIAIGLTALLGLASFGLAFDRGAPQHSATLLVDQSNSMIAGAPVLMRGIEIGRVTQVRTAANGVEVEFRYHDSVAVPIDSEFRIDQLSMLGESYVDIVPRTADGPYLRDGQRVHGAEQTGVGDVVAAVVDLTHDLSPDHVHTIVAAIQAALPDTSATIAELERTARMIALSLSANREPTRNLLRSGAALLAHSEEMATGIHATGPQALNISTSFAALVKKAFAVMDTNDYPRILEVGALALFSNLQRVLDGMGPDLRTIAQPLVDPIAETVAGLRTVDIGRVVDTVLSTSSVAGQLSVRVGQKPR